jgi:hypothetical protein
MSGSSCFWVAKWKTNDSRRMTASFLWFQSALHFFLNTILNC